MLLSYGPAISVGLAVLAALMVLVSGKRLRRYIVLAASIVDSAVVLSILPSVLRGERVEYISPAILSLSSNLSIHFRVDPLGAFFSLITTLMWVLITIYTIGFINQGKLKDERRFFFAYTMAFAAGIGLGYSGSLFTFIIFYEILSIALYPLIIHDATDAAMRAGRKYLLYSLFGGVLILGATAITYNITGTLIFSINGFMEGTAGPDTLRLLFGLFILGFGVKSAIMPLHGWLPETMISPIPVNALLATVEVGVFGMARLVFNIYGAPLTGRLGLGLPLAVVAAITILVASIYAMRQDNLKMRLAYSTISQLSYVVLGIALLTENSALGGLIHIAHQAVMKNTLFFAAGAILLMSGKNNISEFNGLGREMPVTMAAFTIAALGVIGFPPFAGFITKWYLALGAADAGQTLFLLVILASAMLNAVYYLPPIYAAYLKEPNGGARAHDPPILMLAPMVITAIYVVVLGMLANLPYGPLELVRMAVKTYL